MKIPPSYVLNHEMIEIIAHIDSYRHFFHSFPLSSHIKSKVQRASLLKSSLFSARIEGNPLTFDDIDPDRIGIESSSNQQKKIEVLNIIEAIKHIEKKLPAGRQIKEKFILSLHAIVMKNLARDAGFFRREMSAIFNQAGIAVYLTPPPTQITGLISRLLAYLNNNDEKFPLIQAFIAHLIFEKIHPFVDGNGRVGRLLIYVVLKVRSYDFRLFVPYEEYLDERKSDYYYYLDHGLIDATSYLLFMFKGFLTQLEKLKQSLSQEMSKKEELLLLPPRREEIYQIIKDHGVISFDFLRRRFLKVPARTLRYDLKKLVENGYLVKIGKTKGSYYKAKK